MIIQVVLIIAVFIIAVYVLGRRNTHSGRAWQKIALFALFLLMVIVVAFPEISNQLAHSVGVGRGADLLLYMAVIGLVFSILSNYLNRQDQRDKTYRLARKLALLEAEERYHLDGASKKRA